MRCGSQKGQSFVADIGALEICVVQVPLRTIAFWAERLKIFEDGLPSARSRNDMVDVNRSFVLAHATEGAFAARRFENLIPEAVRHRFIEKTIVPHREAPLLHEILQLLLTEHHYLCPLDEVESARVQRNEITLLRDDAVLFQDAERHALDGVLVIDQLALVLSQKSVSELPQCRATARFDERPDQEWLVDVAHRHAVLDEVYELLEGHASPATAEQLVPLFQELSPWL
jgi:hypothetical protein